MLDEGGAAFSPPQISSVVTKAAAVVVVVLAGSPPSSPCSLAVVAGLSPRAHSGSRVIFRMSFLSPSAAIWPPAWAREALHAGR